MNRSLEFLLSDVYRASPLHPDHLADLRKSGITDETVGVQKIRTIPPSMIGALLGFAPAGTTSAYVIPFANPSGGWFDHMKAKVFSADQVVDVRGDHVGERPERWRYNGGAPKYLTRRHASPRVFFPIATMGTAVSGSEPLWLIEGEKKALAVAQLGLPTVGIESAWGWHVKGSTALLPDFDLIRFAGRIVELVPDSDVATNASIERAMRQLADALRAVGALPRLVRLPEAA